MIKFLNCLPQLSYSQSTGTPAVQLFQIGNVYNLNPEGDAEAYFLQISDSETSSCQRPRCIDDHWTKG